jgi:hypothetical protein
MFARESETNITFQRENVTITMDRQILYSHSVVISRKGTSMSYDDIELRVYSELAKNFAKSQKIRIFWHL